MTKKELTSEEQAKADKIQLAKDYSEMVEAKLRKAEKHTWMIRDLDHLKQ